MVFGLEGLARSISYFLPLFSALVCFWVYTRFIGNLSVSDTFSLILLFNNLIHPILLSLNGIMVRYSAAISDKRIGDLFEKKDIQPIFDDPKIEKGSISITEAEFKWTQDDENTIVDQQSEAKTINNETKFSLKIKNKFIVKKGEFIGVFGRIGSGKSSLILSILGEVNQV